MRPCLPVLRQSFPGSSALSGAQYDPDTQTLTVTFKGGSTSYTYPNVPPDVYEQLTTADSPGRFWRESIKDRYG